MLPPNEVEKLVLGTCLAHPNGTENLPQKVVYELDISRFDGPSHPHIYSAIKNCVHKKIVPNPANVAFEMKSTLDNAGGVEYLNVLTTFPALIGVHDTQGIGEWVRQVDLLGRARLIHTILNKKVGLPLEEFQKRVLEADDPEKYLADLTIEVNRFVSGSKSDYRPFSEAVEKFEQMVKASMRGEVTDIIPCGIPNLEKYCIPRPRSFGVISGLSGQGKTQLGIYVGIGTAIDLFNRKENGQVSINTLEQSGERIAMRVACMMSGVNSLSIAQARITKAEADRLFEKCDFIKNLPIVYNDDPTITSSQFVTHAICEHLKNPRVLGISDYVELFKDKAESEELRISGATRNIRTVCWETGSCEIMIVQVNDTAVNSSYKVGGMFSSRYSRAPAHAADWFIELVNYPQLEKAQLKATIPDNRNGQMAYALIEKNKDYPIGEEAFEWTAEYTLFRDTSLPLGKIYREYKREADF
jgi:replicative DNA helicase